jgi:hypothetical protein
MEGRVEGRHLRDSWSQGISYGPDRRKRGLVMQGCELCELLDGFLGSGIQKYWSREACPAVDNAVANRLKPAKEARGAKQTDRLDRRLAVVGRRDGPYRLLATLPILSTTPRAMDRSPSAPSKNSNFKVELPQLRVRILTDKIPGIASRSAARPRRLVVRDHGVYERLVERFALGQALRVHHHAPHLLRTHLHGHLRASDKASI